MDKGLDRVCRPPLRNPSIELLRVVLMFFIVLHHCCIYGIWSDSTSCARLFACTILAVPTFVAISGWFGITFSLLKLIRLCALLAFYTLLNYALYEVSRRGLGLAWPPMQFQTLTSFLGRYWFVLAYVELMILAGPINWCVGKLSSRCLGIRIVVYVVFLLMLCGLKGLSLWHDLSVMTLVVVYVVARCSAFELSCNKIDKARVFKAFFVSALVWCGVYVWQAGKAGGCFQVINECGFYYSHPMVICMSVITVVAVQMVKVSEERVLSVLSNVTRLAPLMFGVYLMHEGAFGKRVLYVPLQEKLACLAPDISHALIVLASAVCCFAICLIIERGRRAAVSAFAGKFI